MESILKFTFTFGIVIVTLWNCYGQLSFAQTNPAAIRFLKREKPPAYQYAVSQLLLAEANNYATQLGLPETLPITTNTTTEIFVSSPSVAERFGALGSLHTTNFAYGYGKGNHLCYVMRRIAGDNPHDYNANKKYAIPSSAIDTNAAYQLATQFLAKAYVDLNRLSTSSVVSVEPWVILHMTTSKYTVQWERNGRPVVKVVLAEPQKELWTLRVEDPSLIMRKPLEITNLDFLLSQTNIPATIKLPVNQ